MPTIAGPNSSPYKQILVVRSEKIGSAGNDTRRKRKLRSDSAMEAASMRGSPISTPMKWKSPRRSAACSPRTPDKEIKEDSNDELESPAKSAVKSLSDCFDAKLNWNPRDNAQLKAVKEALHVSRAPSSIVCRDDEQRWVFEFVKDCVEQEKAGSLYICGCPGTGKSLSMERVKQQVNDWAKQEGLPSPDTVSVNCTSLTNAADIFNKILGENQAKGKVNGSSSPLKHLQNLFSQKQQSPSSKMMLIIADEMDYLITKDRGILHDLFMLTTLPFSRIILIGVANAIDLADRFLPRLKSLNCKPVVVTFRAYSKDQILRILQERLMELPFVAFESNALELCARKVAAASGDMRKALCVCRSALEILETDARELTESDSTGSTPENLMVKMTHMAAALSRTFKSPVVDTIQSLPQHQQMIICSAAKAFRGPKKDTTLGELNKLYLEICKSSMIPAAGITEFSNMCTVLNDQGLLKLGQAREDKLKRVTLKVDESDITFALQGIRFFRNCLL
ncbi:PREDICTED: cell division control protein 6 homolog [Tarenaya hassleriana]|uniref:cell division control protein 6 homolog n=1 Tax=Tarenaya hassleriana TaxID=28532 RepID=UPI00053C6F27|nr:PREDICTED: cell division control protein 6 homolog [Tarenaya hassleriana]